MSFFETLESRELLAVTGTRDLLYVRVRFSDQTAWPESVTSAQNVTAQATKAITDYSGQNVKFRTAIQSVTLPHNTTYYKSHGTTAIANDTDAALKSQGVSLTGIEHVSYRYNGPIGTFGGLGQVGGPKTWIRYTSGSILAHEMGHNLGLGHAHFANPTDNSKPFGASTLSEYGDPFSNMGSGDLKDWNASEKYSRGWLGGARTRVLDGTSVGTYRITLTAHDDAATYSSTNTYLIKLNINSSTSYYISYRHSPDAVFIHRGPASNPTSASLIDANPQTETASDAGLALGKKITDPRGAATSDDITIATADAGIKATITITIGAPKSPAVAPPAAVTTSTPVYKPITSIFSNKNTTPLFA